MTGLRGCCSSSTWGGSANDAVKTQACSSEGLENLTCQLPLYVVLLVSRDKISKFHKRGTWNHNSLVQTLGGASLAWLTWLCSTEFRGWVGLWGFLWWAPSAKGKDHHGVSSGWSSVWHRSNTGLSSTQYEQIPIILGVWPFWLTPFFFRSITFWRAYG